MHFWFACYRNPGYHGAILLAHAQGDRGLIEAETDSLKRWLRVLPRG